MLAVSRTVRTSCCGMLELLNAWRDGVESWSGAPYGSLPV